MYFTACALKIQGLNIEFPVSFVDSHGALPTAIVTGSCSTAANEICKTGGTCTGITDLSVLTASETYLVSMPFDPTTATTNGTGYFAFKSANGRVTVCAPGAELTQTISVTR